MNPSCTIFSLLSASALDAAASLGGEDLIPFYNLLDGGREGEFFKVIMLITSVVWQHLAGV